MNRRRPWIACALAAALAASACRAAEALLPALPTSSALPDRPSATTTVAPAAAVTPATLEPTRPPADLAPLPPTPDLAPGGAGQQEVALRQTFRSDLEIPVSSRYDIEVSVEFDPQRQVARLTGVARVRYQNRTGQTLDNLPFLLWPNDPQYRSEMQAGPVLVDGVLEDAQVELDGLALRVNLPGGLEPGGQTDISLPFTIDASGPIGGLRPYRFGVTEGVLLAPTFYPLIPRWTGEGFQVQAAPPNGDTTNSDAAHYRVRIDIPAGFQVVASGTEVDRVGEAGDRVSVTFVSGPMRDFAFALGEFTGMERSVQGTLVRVWVLPEHADEARAVLDAAALQLSVLNERVGPYPYAELDVVDAPGAFGGIEYPGLVFIGTVGGADQIHPTVHEVGHQWFYGLIGSDQLTEPWLDEAAATYSEALYLEERFGRGSATGMLSDFRRWLRSSSVGETPIGLPLAAYPDVSDYGLIVYLKGALFFDALRTELGDETFFAFLREYFAEFRYGFATAADFENEAEKACGCTLDDLFELWVSQGGELPGP